MVLLDDLGYSDLGVYGGDISTPNIDALAGEGTQFTDFHANAICAPTRASLMTGQDPHMVGLGTMGPLTPPGVQTTTFGYKGSLEGEFESIAQVLSDANYDTYQVGKWHLGETPEQSPQTLGFHQNYTMFEGGASHYESGLQIAPVLPGVNKAKYERNGEPIEHLPEGFYSTDNYTDEMIDMIDGGSGDDSPFFGYLAYTAPHDPLHVPDADLIQKYLDMYLGNSDYKKLRADRVSHMAELGLIDADIATAWPAQTPDWNTLTEDQKTDLAYRLAVYSAMIEYADTQIGRLIDHLKDTGKFDNTLIMLASDNGAAGVSRDLYTQAPGGLDWLNKNYPAVKDVETYGEPGSFTTLGLPNALVSSGPYMHSKGTLFEGGTRAPLIVKTPGGTDAGRKIDTLAHVSDLYPTIADYAGTTVVNTDVLLGDSMKPMLEGTSEEIGDDQIGSELFGQRAFRDGKMKLLYTAPGHSGTGEWALYDLSTDPGETNDLAAQNPEEVKRLAALWEQYAEKNNVIGVDFAAVNAAVEKMAPVFYSMNWAE